MYAVTDMIRFAVGVSVPEPPPVLGIAAGGARSRGAALGTVAEAVL